MLYLDRNNTRGPCEYDEVTKTPDDDGDTVEGSGISGGNGNVVESPFGSELRLCF